MTTYTFTGYKITTDEFGAATATEATTFNLTTTDTFFLRYTLDNPPLTGYSPIIIAPTTGAAYSLVVDGTRVELSGTASVAELTWTSGKKTQVMIFEVPGELGVKHIFQLGGSALPVLDSTAAYDAFMASVTSIDPTIDGYYRAANDIVPSLLSSYSSATLNDTIIADPLMDSWVGQTIKTGAGNDFVTGLSTADKVELGDGNDFSRGLGGNDTIVGGNGNDTLYGGDQNDALTSGAGNDLLYGGNGDDVIWGGLGVDTIYGSTGADRLNGDDGTDFIFGGTENDTLNGGAGDDHMDGGDENDVLAGGVGADWLNGADGNDTVGGGFGSDTVYGSSGDDRLSGDDNNDTISGGSGTDSMYGGTGNDFIDGGSDNDLIFGSNGHDVLLGDSGNDTISGGSGDDNIYGESGADVLVGGLGADDFFFALSGGLDRIGDFANDIDQIAFDSNLGVTSAAEALALATQVGANVVFDFGDGDTLVVNNILKAALADDIIIF